LINKPFMCIRMEENVIRSHCKNGKKSNSSTYSNIFYQCWASIQWDKSDFSTRLHPLLSRVAEWARADAMQPHPTSLLHRLLASHEAIYLCLLASRRTTGQQTSQQRRPAKFAACAVRLKLWQILYAQPADSFSLKRRKNKWRAYLSGPRTRALIYLRARARG